MKKLILAAVFTLVVTGTALAYTDYTYIKNCVDLGNPEYVCKLRCTDYSNNDRGFSTKKDYECINSCVSLGKPEYMCNLLRN